MMGWVPKSSVCPSKPRETQTFWRVIPGFCPDIPGVPENFEKERFMFNSRPMESCDVNGPRSDQNANPAKQRPVFPPLYSPSWLSGIGLEVPQQRQFHTANHVIKKCCDLCAQCVGTWIIDGDELALTIGMVSVLSS